MVPTQEDRSTSSDLPEPGIPGQRAYSDRVQVLADDRLIEAIRTGQLSENAATTPLDRLLIRWRRQVLAGL